jgi:hypothetical protein
MHYPLLRSRRGRALLLLPVAAVLAGAAGAGLWLSRQPDAQVVHRIDLLRRDPLLTALAAGLGHPPHSPTTRWSCTMELPPAYLVEFPAPVDAATAERLAAIARSSGWSAQVNPQPGPVIYVDLHKSFGSWSSDSLLTLDPDGLTVDLATTTAMSC